MVVFEGGRSKRERLSESSRSAPCPTGPMISPPCTRSYCGATVESSRRVEELPDLILIDGGRGQLGSALDALTELGLSHLPDRVVGQEAGMDLPTRARRPAGAPRSTRMARQLLQRVRDEAHRFAVTFHRQQRKARDLGFVSLQDIPGIGPKRRKMLLREFGSVSGVKAASPETLEQVLGKRLAAMRDPPFRASRHRLEKRSRAGRLPPRLL